MFSRKAKSSVPGIQVGHSDSVSHYLIVAAIPSMMPGPFYCWYTRVEPVHIQIAHELVHEIIEEEGPFDGVIAFSQGAALALSILMHQELNNPGDRPLFSFAALFSCPIVLSPDTKLNLERLRDATSNLEPDEPEKITLPTKEAPKHRFSLLLTENQRALAQEYRSILDDAKERAHEMGVPLSDEDSDDGSESDEELSRIPRLIHPLMVNARVSIPTVHLYDPTDMYHPQHKLAVRLCDKFLTQDVQHTGGHGLPTDPKQVKACATAILKAVEKGRQRINMF
jgi:hypothetical protein